MAKTSGGVRNSPKSKQTASKVLKIAETQIRNNNYESAIAVNDKGEIIFTKKGKRYEVSFSRSELRDMNNAVVTHNHPRSLGRKGIAAIGNSFSRNDVMLAVSANLKEIRAVTPTYTFSLKRPKGGWGASPEEIGKSYSKINNAVRKMMTSYLDKRDWSDNARTRADVTHYNIVMKKLSQKYGFEYSHKRG